MKHLTQLLYKFLLKYKNIKSILRLSLIILFILSQNSLSLASQGAFIIEPSLGYKQSTLTTTDKFNSNTTSKYTLNAPFGALKLGLYSATGISLSLSAEYAENYFSKVDSHFSKKAKFTHSIGAVQLGVSAMSSIKIYLGYAPFNTLKLNSIESEFNGFTLSGVAYQAGLMFFPFEKMGLGLQYNVNSYSTIKGIDYSTSTKTDDYFSKLDHQDMNFMLNILF